MSYKCSQAERMFGKLKIARASSNHHVKGFVLDLNGNKLFPPVYFNKGRKDLPARIVKKLKTNLGLNDDDFDELISCRMSRHEYLMRRSD